MLTYSWLFLSSDVSALPFAVMKTGSLKAKKMGSSSARTTLHVAQNNLSRPITRSMA